MGTPNSACAWSVSITKIHSKKLVIIVLSRQILVKMTLFLLTLQAVLILRQNYEFFF